MYGLPTTHRLPNRYERKQFCASQADTTRDHHGASDGAGADRAGGAIAARRASALAGADVNTRPAWAHVPACVPMRWRAGVPCDLGAAAWRKLRADHAADPGHDLRDPALAP